MSRITDEQLQNFSEDDLTGDMKINVCASCKTAACWIGEFYCDDYKDADVIQMTVAELREMNLKTPMEHPSYWAKEVRARYGYK